jgi:hypothetical protein
MQAIDKEEYKGFTIETYLDDTFSSDDLDCIGELHCDARDLYMGAKREKGREVSAPLTRNMSVSKMLDILEDNFIFHGDYGSHSGVWLIGPAEELTKKALIGAASIAWKRDKNNETLDDAMHDLSVHDVIDNCGSVLLLIPKDKDKNGKSTGTAYGEKDLQKLAKQCWDTWDNLIQGQVYGYIVKDKDKEELDTLSFSGSCWGYIGDTKNMIEDAKREIDGIDAPEYYKQKYQSEAEYARKKADEAQEKAEAYARDQYLNK